MGAPIAPAMGIAFAFPDVCNTPAGTTTVPIPYPNIGTLASATNVSDSGNGLKVGPAGFYVLLQNSEMSSSSGDEGGSAGPGPAGKVTITSASTTVLYGGHGIVRFGDPTSQNGGNAVGMVLGAFPTVLVGG